MRTWPRVVVVVVVSVVLACSKKKEEPPKADPRAPKPEAPAPEDPPADRPAPPPAKAEPAPSPSPSPSIDCAKLLSADDVAKACGNAKVAVSVSDSQIKTAQEVCRLIVTDPGKQAPRAVMQVYAHADAGAAEGWLKLELVSESKAVAGVGDQAWTTEKEKANLKMTMTEAGARKGRYVVKAQSDKSSMNPKPPCTVTQLLELVKMTIPRLP